MSQRIFKFLFPNSSKEELPKEIQNLQRGGNLSVKDLADFSKAQQKIYLLMKDREWHAATEIIERSGVRSGLRVMRTFRGKGWEVKKKKSAVDSREWLYKLIEKNE